VLRVGFVFPGDSRDPAAWSGTLAGLAGGLGELGVEVVHVAAGLPGAAERALGAALAPAYLRRARALQGGPPMAQARAAARLSAAFVVARSAATNVRMRGSRTADAYVTFGSSFVVRTRRPVLPYTDMTIPQALRYPAYARWHVLSPRGQRFRMRLQRMQFHQATRCCAMTSWAADSIVRDYAVAADRVPTVGCGSNREALRVQRDWSTPRFLWVGKEWERKNGDAVLRAFAALRRERADATLDLVGTHPRVDLPGVRARGALRLEDPDERAQVDELFRRATCFVMPSTIEPSGIAYAEAHAAGIPSIGTVVGGAPQIIGDAGVAVEPGDDAALLAAMRRLADAGEAARLGRAAEARSELFRWGTVAERFLRALGHDTWQGRRLADFL
jgi:glycosyltransferase involved in cell wall biosynthesis